MSLLGDEKASERRFRITGKYTGGVGSSGTWNPASTHTFGNDREAEAQYRSQEPTPSIGERLAAAQKKADLGAKAPKPTVQVPGAKKDTIKSQAVAVAKEAVRKKAKSVLSSRAQSETARLEGLFTR